MKKGWIIAIIIAILIIICFFGFKWLNNNKQNNTPPNNISYNTTRTITDVTNEVNETKPKQIETELYTFSTPIKSSSKNRLTNIKITCSRINETVVKAGKEFSFCDIVGQPTSEDGYKKADVFGANGKITKAIGGRKLSSKYYYLQCCSWCKRS